MTRPFARFAAPAATQALLAALAACGPSYSPNTYSANAVQQAAKVDKGVIIGVRAVDVSASGVVGVAAGAAAGGAIGAETPGGGVSSTLGAIGGGLVGGLVGSTVEHTADDTTAYEYIVRKPNNELVSVTQKDAAPLAVGLHVLVIAGPQARIVRDYTVDAEPATASLTPPPSPKPANPAPGADTPPAATPAAALPPGGTEPPPTPVSQTPLAAPLPLGPPPAKPGPTAEGPAPGANLASPSSAAQVATPAPATP